MVTHLKISFCLMLAQGLSAVAAAEHVTGSVNGTLTLLCTYPANARVNSVCWGQGRCPLLGCNNMIIQTDGTKVTRRKSDRYQLLGKISQGDVSLTITKVTEDDGGTYCCRVKIPGLWNDMKKEIPVRLQETTQKTNSAPTSWTHDSVSVTIPSTSSPDVDSATNHQMTDMQESRMANNEHNVIIISSVVITVILLIALLATVYICRYKIRNKLKPRNNLMITLEGLAEQYSPVEQNIYTDL